MSIHWGGRGLVGTKAARAPVLNETFAAAGAWTLPTGLAISGGTLNKTEAPGTARVATLAQQLYAGRSYSVTATVSGRSAGSIRISLGGTLGVVRNANGTVTETIVAGSDGLVGVSFTTTANTGIALDNLIVVQV
jgi:hypothetical protein